jgi:two-component system, OmpR family, alkaline phosphatase synthesis response regulator PhoP
MPQILLIEDEPLIRDSLEDVLNLEGYSLTTAQNGLAGIEAVKAALPDLIICDINMPEMDGYSVLESLRADPATRDVPFVFLTARSGRADQRQGMDMGADDFLTKPFTVDELLSTVRTRLNRQAVVKQQFQTEQSRNQTLEQKVRTQEDLVAMKAKLLDKVIEEFRTPLSNVNMALSMLERAKGDEERQRYIAILRHEYSRQVGLINEASNLQEMTNAKPGGFSPSFHVGNSKFL